MLLYAMVTGDTFQMPAFSKEDRILISELYKLMGYSVKRLIKEFPTKGWKIQSVNYVLHKLRETEKPTGNQAAADHAMLARTVISTLDKLVPSQGDAPQFHQSRTVASQ